MVWNRLIPGPKPSNAPRRRPLKAIVSAWGKFLPMSRQKPVPVLVRGHGGQNCSDEVGLCPAASGLDLTQDEVYRLAPCAKFARPAQPPEVVHFAWAEGHGMSAEPCQSLKPAATNIVAISSMQTVHKPNRTPSLREAVAPTGT